MSYDIQFLDCNSGCDIDHTLGHSLVHVPDGDKIVFWITECALEFSAQTTNVDLRLKWLAPKRYLLT